MQAKDCKICNTSEYLKPKWNSETQEKWVHCDKCGKTSTPSIDTHPIIIWNQEN